MFFPSRYTMVAFDLSGSKTPSGLVAFTLAIKVTILENIVENMKFSSLPWYEFLIKPGMGRHCLVLANVNEADKGRQTWKVYSDKKLDLKEQGKNSYFCIESRRPVTFSHFVDPPLSELTLVNFKALVTMYFKSWTRKFIPLQQSLFKLLWITLKQ